MLLTYHMYSDWVERVSRPPENQLNIVRTIALEGKKTISQLTDYLGKSQPNISNAVKELLKPELDLIEKTEPPSDFVSGRGNTQQFYRLTPKGIKFAIEDDQKIRSEIKVIKDKKDKKNNVNKISSEKFWKTLSITFSESNTDNISSKNPDFQKIVELIRFYEERILKIKSLNYIPRFFNNWLYENKTLCQEVRDSEIRGWKKSSVFQSYEKIVKSIGYGNPLSLEEPIKIANPMKILGFGSNTRFIHHLVEHGVIQKLESEKIDKYELTHLGVLRLLFYLYEEYWPIFINKHLIHSDENPSLKIQKTNDPDYKKFHELFDKIRVKYCELLPDILSGNTYDILGISDFEIVVLLMQLYFYTVFRLGSEIDIKDEYTEKYHSLKNLEQIRQSFYHRKLLEFLGDFDRIENEFPSNNLVDEIHTTYFLFTYGSESEYYQDLHVLQKTFKYYLYSNQIKNRITFDFYNIYKVYCNGWHSKKIKDSNIRQWHDNQIKELLIFINEYSSDFKNTLEQDNKN